jgi:TonB family protein
VNRPLLAAVVFLSVFVFSALATEAETKQKRRYIPIDIMILQEPPAPKATLSSLSGQTLDRRSEAELQADRLMCLKADIRRQIKREWYARAVKQKGPVAVSFTLWNTGLATDMHVTKSSHSAALDRCAINAVAAASPFKFPPAKPMKIEIVFDQRMNSGLSASLGAVQIADFTY